MNKFCLLILEDAVVTSVAVSRALELELPECLVLRAQSLFEAKLLLKTYDIHFFILDIQLPDGNGTELLDDIVRKNPSAGVVIVTAASLPKHKDSALQYGVLHYMEKPIDPRVLASLAREYRYAAFGAGAGSDTSFSASLRRMTATDIVQLKCLARATVALDFTLRDHRHGRLYFEDGEVVHAAISAHPKTQDKEGADAFREIIGWRGGRVEELNLPAERRTLHASWQELLLDAVQRLDEEAHRQKPKPDEPA
jgi:two-component system, OmpR family, response regulator TctD